MKITDDLIANFVEQLEITESMVKLNEVLPIQELETTNQQKLVIQFLACDDTARKVMGTVFNSIFTQQATTFMLSKRIMTDLVKNDPNHDLKSCNSTTHKLVMKQLFEFNIIRTIESWTGKRAGLYQVVDDMILQMVDEHVSQSIRKERDQKVIAWYYDNLDSIGQDNPRSQHA